jgi:hypothetical protein
LRDKNCFLAHCCPSARIIAVCVAAVHAAGCGPDSSVTGPAETESAAAVSRSAGFQPGASTEASAPFVSAASEPFEAAASQATGSRGVSAATRLRDISFDDVKFEMEKGDPFTRDLLPPAVTALEGQRVRIRGYILPSFQQEGITQFVLVRDNMECCFGPGAALYDCVVVRMLPGRSTSFSVRPVAVTGTFHLEELVGPDKRHLAIYSLDGEQVE